RSEIQIDFLVQADEDSVVGEISWHSLPLNTGQWRRRMPCPKYKELEEQLKSARSGYAYFAIPENKRLRSRTSDLEAKRMAKAAPLGKQTHLTSQMTMHVQECGECRKTPHP